MRERVIHPCTAHVCIEVLQLFSLLVVALFLFNPNALLCRHQKFTLFYPFYSITMPNFGGTDGDIHIDSERVY